MNRYCTYFDRGFLIQGLALWRSLAAHDPEAQLWVLALDDFTGAMLRELGDAKLEIVPLGELERDDAALAAAKANRTRVEYFFTLSPCWPRWLLARHPEIERVTYVDADMFFFASPTPIFSAMDAAAASVLVTAHRFPAWLRHYERHGKFNVGILSFRNDAVGRACLDDWRTRCLAWCFDRLEDGKYADQKYLDDWPEQFGAALLALGHPGVNLAPWNWRRYESRASAEGGVRVDGQPLVLFHAARFRPRWGAWCWDSGQLEYGVMAGGLRDAIYLPYVKALLAARAEIATRRAGFDFARRPARLGRDFWERLPFRVVFGGDWWLIADRFWDFRFGLGRWSGQCRAKIRKIFLRT